MSVAVYENKPGDYGIIIRADNMSLIKEGY